MPRAGFFASAHVASGGGGSGVLEFVGGADLAGAGTVSDTFDLGAAAADRFVLVGLVANSTSNGAATVTVGGASVPELFYLNDRNRVWIHGAVVASGSSVTIAGTPSSGTPRMWVWVGRGMEPSGEVASNNLASAVSLTTVAGDAVAALAMSYQSAGDSVPGWSVNLTSRLALPGNGSASAAADGVAAGSSFVGDVAYPGEKRSLVLFGMRSI